MLSRDFPARSALWYGWCSSGHAHDTGGDRCGGVSMPMATFGA
jgi:hypothetical protein